MIRLLITYQAIHPEGFSKKIVSKDASRARLGVFILFCLSLASCAKSPSQKELVTHTGDDTLQQLYLQEAKNVDIPVPVGFTLAPERSEAEQQFHSCFSYKGVLPVSDVLRFYRQSMEQNGWDIRDLSAAHEGLIICSKADKQCVISIRPVMAVRAMKTGKSTIHIFLYKESLIASYQQDGFNSKSIAV